MVAPNFVPRINVATAWRRMYAMTKPFSASQNGMLFYTIHWTLHSNNDSRILILLWCLFCSTATFRILKWTCVLSWPVMAAFTKYTMEMDIVRSILSNFSLCRILPQPLLTFLSHFFPLFYSASTMPVPSLLTRPSLTWTTPTTSSTPGALLALSSTSSALTSTVRPLTTS